MSFSEQYFFSQLQNFPAGQLPQIRENLKGLTPEQEDRILQAEIKSSTHALILSVGAGYVGADRFYNGDTGLGVGKAVVFGLGVLFMVIPLLNIFIGLPLLLASSIWSLIDWFLIQNAVKTKNAQRLNVAIKGYDSAAPVVGLQPGQVPFNPAAAPVQAQHVPFDATQGQAPVQSAATPLAGQEVSQVSQTTAEAAPQQPTDSTL